MTVKTQAISIFDRVQGDVFRPLAGPNRSRMWRLLIDLYDEFFGPDAALVPEDGFTHRTITQAIERHLLTHPGWSDEEIDPLTPVNVRANLLLNRLVDCGWVRDERIGVRNFVGMRPEVGKFLEHLKQYAEDGPADLGGSIQIIHNTLKEAERDPQGQAPAFRRAAKEARDLVATLNHTHVRVREVMSSLSSETSTAGYIRAFFDDYISGIFIRDYRELRTTNHPLRNRHEILRIVSELRDDRERRDLLAVGYRKLLSTSEPDAIDVAMSKDFDRLRRFEDIELYLERLDSSVTRAARQALTYITYRLRTRDRIDRLLQQTADAVARQTGETILTPWGVGNLFSEGLLREPTIRKPPAPRIPVKKREPTLEERALWNLQRLMVRNREVTPAAATAYLQRQLTKRSQMTSEEMQIESIQDLVIFAALARVAHHRARVGAFGSDVPLSRGLQQYQFTLDAGAVTENEYILVPRFTVQLETRST